ncbi:divergent PAP2 family protein [Paenibacillus marinisediminis]
MYFIVPILSWFISGILKLSINYIRYGSDAKKMIGNGGFPSTHTTVVVSTAAAIGFTKGFDTDIFGLAVCLCVIVIIDATGIRRALGNHAKSINELTLMNGVSGKKHRERQGHSKEEVIGGIILGVIIGYLFGHIV